MPIILGASAVISGSAAYALRKRKSPQIVLRSEDPIANKGGVICKDGNKLIVSRGKELAIMNDRGNGRWSIATHKYKGTKSLSNDGTTLVVGCPDAPRGKRHGRVLIYRRKKDVWTVFDELFPSHGEKDGCFGRMVSLKGDKLLVAGDTMWAVYKESNGRFHQVKFMFAEQPYELVHPGLAVCKNAIVDVLGKKIFEYEDFKGPRQICYHEKSGLIMGWDAENKVIAGSQTFQQGPLQKDGLTTTAFGQGLALNDDMLFVLSDSQIFCYSYLDEWQLTSALTLPDFAKVECGKMIWSSGEHLYLSCPSIDLIYKWTISKN